MGLIILIKGVFMGLAIAAPVGPIALLCIRRTLDKGRWIGLATGLGAATADGFYGMVAAFGLTAISDLLVAYTHYLQIVGGFFLIYLGLTTFLAKSAISVDAFVTAQNSSAEKHADEFVRPLPTLSSRTLLPAYTSTLALTLTNPATILSFLAIFAGLGITQADYLHSVTLVFGVFTGSAAWWLVLVSGVVLLRNRLTPQRLTQFNRWSTKVFGVLILGFGIAALLI